MKILKSAVMTTLLFTMVAWCISAQAGPFTDTLSRCLVKSTTEDDRATLVRWLFAVMALHPSVKPIALIDEKQRDSANQATASMIMKLLTDSCLEETKEAIQYEGNNALELSFEVLGQVAAQELFSNPAVSAGMSGLEKHLDAEKLGVLFTGD